ncbi:MAG: hypothetical protein ACI4DY_09645 [Monoglobaceae bacterium]
MFRIIGLIDGVEQSIEYTVVNGTGSYKGDLLVDFKMRNALESLAPTGPVGQFLERDLNNPLSAFCMMLECFDEVIKTEGNIPTAAELPDGAIG